MLEQSSKELREILLFDYLFCGKFRFLRRKISVSGSMEISGGKVWTILTSHGCPLSYVFKISSMKYDPEKEIKVRKFSDGCTVNESEISFVCFFLPARRSA